MKTKHKLLASFISSILILLLLGLWIYMAEEPFSTVGYLIFGLSALLIAFGLYFNIQRFKSEKLGLTSDDELSKRIMEKAAARAFIVSIYMWATFIIFFTGIGPRGKIIMGIGLIGMGLVFFLNWFYYSKIGVTDEDKN